MTASSTFRTDVQLVQMPAKQARGRVSSSVLGLAHRKCARLGNARGVPSLWRAGATSIAGKDFCLQTRQRARCRAGPRAFYKLRDDGIVPLICPTCQNVFAGFAQGIDASDHHATLHGVVFDILVGSESRVQTLSASRQLPLRWGEPLCRQGLCVGLHRRSRRQV